jgi:HSP20 family protein
MSTSMTKRDDHRLENVAERQAVAPRVDIFENKEELLLVADMPGMSQDQLRINLDDEQLTIEGRAADDERQAVQREFRLFDYRREFVVPGGIDRNKISAEIKDGVLWLHLPKAEALKPRRIEVKSG